MKKKYTTSDAIYKIERHGFQVKGERIFGKDGKGTNGTGGAIDYLVQYCHFSYHPNEKAPRH